MRAIIKVIRKTEYCSVVDMSQERFDELRKGWDGPTKKERDATDKVLNALIDTKDWQDDELHSVEEFKEFNDK